MTIVGHLCFPKVPNRNENTKTLLFTFFSSMSFVGFCWRFRSPTTEGLGRRPLTFGTPRKVIILSSARRSLCCALVKKPGSTVGVCATSLFAVHKQSFCTNQYTDTHTVKWRGWRTLWEGSCWCCRVLRSTGTSCAAFHWAKWCMCACESTDDVHYGEDCTALAVCFVPL